MWGQAYERQPVTTMSPLFSLWQSNLFSFSKFSPVHGWSVRKPEYGMWEIILLWWHSKMFPWRSMCVVPFTKKLTQTSRQQVHSCVRISCFHLIKGKTPLCAREGNQHMMLSHSFPVRSITFILDTKRPLHPENRAICSSLISFWVEKDRKHWVWVLVLFLRPETFKCSFWITLDEDCNHQSLQNNLNGIARAKRHLWLLWLWQQRTVWGDRSLGFLLGEKVGNGFWYPKTQWFEKKNPKIRVPRRNGIVNDRRLHCCASQPTRIRTHWCWRPCCFVGGWTRGWWPWFIPRLQWKTSSVLVWESVRKCRGSRDSAGNIHLSVGSVEERKIFHSHSVFQASLMRVVSLCFGWHVWHLQSPYITLHWFDELLGIMTYHETCSPTSMDDKKGLSEIIFPFCLQTIDNHRRVKNKAGRLCSRDFVVPFL